VNSISKHGGINLVGGIPTPLKNMSSSVGMMKFPTEWKKNVPNHQPAIRDVIIDNWGYGPYLTVVLME